MSNQVLHQLLGAIHDLLQHTRALHRERIVLAKQEVAGAKGDNFASNFARERLEALSLEDERDTNKAA